MIIPVRVQTDSPITHLGGIRNLRPDHPLAQHPCPVCDGPLTDAPVTLVFVGIDPRARAEAKTWCTGAAVAVHADCAGFSQLPTDDRPENR